MNQDEKCRIEIKQEEKYQLTWKSWLSLAVLIISFSGIFTKSDILPLRALDFQVLVGHFGQTAAGIIFTGKGGIGADAGFLFALTLFPTLMFALGLIHVAEALGALRAAGKLFHYILRPLLGIPGAAGLAFVSGFTSTDVTAVMTKGLVDDHLMTDDERTVFVAYQYAGAGTITNTFGSGAALVPICVLPIGAVICIILAVKIIGANLLRFYVYRHGNKSISKQRSAA